MATLVHSDSRRMYSWWWDSHISPKNSKWLLENLADMDTKVKSMIKLIEEDGDTFAKRAEMYYRKRPELLQLVEGFYRAYRALAERYDHARVGLRHAHKTIAEVFPDQVPALNDDSFSDLSSEFEAQALEALHPFHSLLDTDNLNKDMNGSTSSNSYSVRWNGEKGLKQFSEMFKVEDALKNLKLAQELGTEGLDENLSCQSVDCSDFQVGNDTGNELEALRLAVSKMQAEKESIAFQYHQSLEQLSNLESKLNLTEEEVKEFDEQRRLAENEIEILKEELKLSQAERDACIGQCQELLEKKNRLEVEVFQAVEEAKALSEQASNAEAETQNLKFQVSKLEADREAGNIQYERCLSKIDLLENKLLSAEENMRVLNERNEVAEAEVEKLREAVNKLNEEKATAALQYIQCSEIITNLQSELYRAQEDIKRINSELLGETSKLKSAEEQCASLNRSNESLKSEVDDLVKVIVSKDLDIADKQNELEKLQTRVQEEHSQLLKVEDSLSTWQKLHSQSQEDHRVLAMELRNGLQMLKDLEISKHNLQEELYQVKEENRNLSEYRVSSTIKLETLGNEATCLRDVKEKLDLEVARRADISNVLEQEISSLKEEIGNLNQRYQVLLEQIELVGLRPESLGSSLKELLDECAQLKEVCKQKQNENEILLQKLDNMSMVLQQNAALETSLLNLTGELVEANQTLKALRESSELFQSEKLSLVAEKASLILQLQNVTESMRKLFEKNSILEDSLAVTNQEVQGLRQKSKNFEEICQLLKNDKSVLQNEKDILESQLEDVKKKLERSEEKFCVVEEKYASLEKDKLSTLRRIEELQISLGLEKQERTCFKESSEARLASLETHISLLNDEDTFRKKEYEKHEKAMRAEVEILVLQKFIRDLEEKNLTLMTECQQQIEKSKLTNKLIEQLDKENVAQQAETDFLIDEIEKLRLGISHVFKALGDGFTVDSSEMIEEQGYIPLILQRVEMMKEDAQKNEDERQHLLVEKLVLVTFIEQVKLEMAEFQSDKAFDHGIQLQIASTQSENHELLELNRLLRFEVSEGDQLEEVLKAERDNLYSQLLDLQKKFLVLQEEQSEALEENACLLNECSELRRQKQQLEDENNSMLHESVLSSNLSSIFEGYGNEKDVQVKQLTESLDYLSDVNNDLEREVETITEKLENKEKENLHLKESVQTMRKELFEVKDLNGQLYAEVLSGRKYLAKKELELSKVKQRLKVSDDLNMEISMTTEALKMEFENSKLICEDLGKQILELSNDNINLKRESKYLREEKEKLESELCELHEDVEMHRTREQCLSSELLEKETSTNDAETEVLKSRVCSLETELQELKAQLSAYPPVIDSLKDDISSLEDIALYRAKLHITNWQDSKDVKVTADFQGIECCSRVSDLEEIRHRIKMVQKAVIDDVEGPAKLRSLNLDLKPRGKSEDTENMKSFRTMNPELYSDSLESWTTFSVASEGGSRVLMKDIPLDEVSDSSISGIIQKGNGAADDQMLELWETAEQSNGRHSKVKGKHKKAYDTIYHQYKDVGRQTEHTIEFLVEKELGIDKQEVVKVIDPCQEEIKNKALEKLASDAKKLNNTQAMVQDLRVRLDTISKSKRTKEFEFETMKEQLQEVEETSVQLMETNSRLRKNIEKKSSSSGNKSCADWEEIGTSRRRRIYEQARRSSEKIGRLHVEAQKIQGVVQSLQDKKKSSTGSTTGIYRFSQARTSILLRTFMHRGSRNGRRQRNPCFGCMTPVDNDR